MQITNHNVHRVLVGNRSLVDVLFYLTYNQMRFPPKVLKPTNIPLYSFSGYNVQPFGGVELPIIASSHPTQVRIFTFLMVNMLSIYIIIGQPTLNTLLAVASIYYMAIKFPIIVNIIVIYVNQVKVRRYYVLALKEKGSNH